MRILDGWGSFVLTLIVIISVSYMGTNVTADDYETIININPSTQIIFPGETFDISIYCVPDQPIKRLN